jgi:phage terminase small subunit
MSELNIPTDLQTAPEHLSARARLWFDHILAHSENTLPDVVLVIAFLEQADMAEYARLHVNEEGPVFKDRWGQPRENPWLKIHREAHREMGRLYRELRWNKDPIGEQMDLPGVYTQHRGPGRPNGS